MFVYTPRSGDRVFVSNPKGNQVLVTLSNSSHHVVGGVAPFSIETARAGSWWRHAAKQALKSITLRFGGVAWDFCGSVFFAAPTAAVRRLALLVLAESARRSRDLQAITFIGDLLVADEFVCYGGNPTVVNKNGQLAGGQLTTQYVVAQEEAAMYSTLVFPKVVLTADRRWEVIVDGESLPIVSDSKGSISSAQWGHGMLDIPEATSVASGNIVEEGEGLPCLDETFAEDDSANYEKR